MDSVRDFGDCRSADDIFCHFPVVEREEAEKKVKNNRFQTKYRLLGFLTLLL